MEARPVDSVMELGLGTVPSGTIEELRRAGAAERIEVGEGSLTGISDFGPSAVHANGRRELGDDKIMRLGASMTFVEFREIAEAS